MSEVGLSPELITSQHVLYRGTASELVIPESPNIPYNEGLHVESRGQHDSADTPKEILSRYLLALGAAKVVAESNATRDAWANTRLEAGGKISVYGRVPGEEGSWRKPVDADNREVPRSQNLGDFYDENKLKVLFTAYMPKWEDLGRRMELFPNGVYGKDTYVENDLEPVVWENDHFTLVVVRNPHLEGRHLVVHPKDSFSRQWMTVLETRDDTKKGVVIQEYIQATLEATSIAMGVQEILAPKQGEIHNSGNWAGGLRYTEEGGKLSLEDLEKNRKLEKKKHRPDVASEDEGFGTGMHVHVYIPEKTGDLIALPAMPKGEAAERLKQAKERGKPTQSFEAILEKWRGIPTMSNEDIDAIRQQIGDGRLTAWINGNCRGKLK